MSPIIYTRPVFYYETDRMDCVHHSNYIRWFEEARVNFMKEAGFSYEGLEAAGIVSPVLSAEANYHAMCRFGETMEILIEIESYSRTRIAFHYQVKEKESGQLRCDGWTCHCFINSEGRPLSLKKAMPDYHQKIEDYMAQNQSSQT